jgi:hypothetical protein
MIAVTAAAADVRRRAILEQLFPPPVDVDDDNSEANDVDADVAGNSSVENSSSNNISGAEGPQCAICLEGIGESWM